MTTHYAEISKLYDKLAGLQSIKDTIDKHKEKVHSVMHCEINWAGYDTCKFQLPFTELREDLLKRMDNEMNRIRNEIQKLL